MRREKKLVHELLKLVLIATAITTMASCKSVKQNHTLWVNSYKTHCVGVGPMSCLMVQETETIDYTKWESFFNKIEGFSYEPGYIYKLKVKTEELDPKDIPADASSLKYSLVKIISKDTDLTLRINDTWIVQTITGIDINKIKGTDRYEFPKVEIQLASKKVLGYDGCNYLNGTITFVSDDQIAFGPIAGTKKLCAATDAPPLFNKALSQVKYYSIKERTLYFYDKNHNELLTFLKAD